MSKIDTEKAEVLKHENRRAIKKSHKQYPHLPKEILYKKFAADPVIAELHPLKYFGAISEKMEDRLKSYLKKECASV